MGRKIDIIIIIMEKDLIVSFNNENERGKQQHHYLSSIGGWLSSVSSTSSDIASCARA